MREWIDLVAESLEHGSYYHVTERDYVPDIVENGFLGGWGDVGFGVYFYGNLGEARGYLSKGGWDGKLEDPVILVVQDGEIEKMDDLDPEWDEAKYADMWWKPMDADSDVRWKPEKIGGGIGRLFRD